MGRAVYLSYDLFNEPLTHIDGNVPAFRQNVFTFISKTHGILKAIHDAQRLPALFTVGWAGLNTSWSNELWRNYGVQESYISYHDYSTVPQDFGRLLRNNLLYATSRQLQLVVSEFWDYFQSAGRLSVPLQAITGVVGGQMWGFLQANSFVLPGPEIGTPAPNPIDGVWIMRPTARYTNFRQVLQVRGHDARDIAAVRTWTGVSVVRPVCTP